jgi:hypothetical protein
MPPGSINENLTECLQRYVALEYERNGIHLASNINNLVVEILVKEHKFEFRHRTGEIWRTITSLLSPWMFSGDPKNRNSSWIRIINNE